MLNCNCSLYYVGFICVEVAPSFLMGNSLCNKSNSCFSNGCFAIYVFKFSMCLLKYQNAWRKEIHSHIRHDCFKCAP